MSRRPRAVLAALAGLAVLAAPGSALAAGKQPQPTWHAEQATVPGAREAGRGGEGVLVAVLDSWVDGAHPDFEGRVLSPVTCARGRCGDQPPTPDECDHGTHVAGTVASSSYGVAPRAAVLPVQVLRYEPATATADAACSGRTSDVAAGIRYAVDHGAHVVNLSLGGDVPGMASSSEIDAAVAHAAAAGVVVVFAAGNASMPVADSFGDDAIVVAATGPDGELASYSQRGTGVTLAAPGGDAGRGGCTSTRCVTSLFPGGRYALAAGTSMAAPHVAGIAALLLAQDPQRTPEQVLRRLVDTAHPLPDAGAGLVDATAALAAVGAQADDAPATPLPEETHAPSPAPAGTPPTTAAAAPAPPPPPPATATPPPLPPAPAQPAPAASPAPTAAPAPVAQPPPGAVPVPVARSADLPAAPLALAGALVAVAAVTTAAVGMRTRPAPVRGRHSAPRRRDG